MMPNPLEVRYAIVSMSAASVILKRRIEKLAPNRKLARLKRNVLPPQCLRRWTSTLPAANSREDVGDGSAVATTVDEFTGFGCSCVMFFFSSHIDSIQVPCRRHYTRDS